MKSWLRPATRVFTPVAVVGAVVVASYFSPVHLSAVLAVACSYTSPTPTVTAVSPTTGSTSGGNSVVITGTQFCNGAVTVLFGATAATGVTVNSNTQITAVSPAHVAGSVDVTVTTAGGTSATSSADMFTFAAICATVSISAAPASPSASGTPVVFTAVSTGCPHASPLYEFWMRAASQTTWQLIQGYSTTATYNWDSTGAANGIVNFGVWVKDASSTTSTFDANASIPYTVTSPCASASVSAAPTSVVQGSGTHSTITGVATGCANTAPLYEFWLRTASTDWILVRAYGVSPTYDWNSTGAPIGLVYFGLWVKDAKSTTSTFDANANTTVNVTPAVCTSVTATAVPTTVVHSTSGGTHVTITGAATGCTNAGQLYEFWLRTATTDWQLVQSYGTGATYDWNSTGAPVGTVYFGVWAKDVHSSTSTFDANASTTVAVT